MNNNTPISSVLPRKGITIISGYNNGRSHVYVAQYSLFNENHFTLTFPKGHTFSSGQRITMHLDNRTGVEVYDADLRVYRISYKGTVQSAGELTVSVSPDEYMMYYSNQCLSRFKAPDFEYDENISSGKSLPASTVGLSDLDWNDREYENKLGVLITEMPSRPHTSLMAFLSNNNDDVFLITMKGTFKSRILHQNNKCCFAIDHRAEFVYEKSYDWNYTIIDADAYVIEESNPAYGEIKYQFVQKNPWEVSFFLSPEIEMFHLKPRRLLLPGCM